MLEVAVEKAANNRYLAQIAAKKASDMAAEKANAEAELARVKKRLQEMISVAQTRSAVTGT